MPSKRITPKKADVRPKFKRRKMDINATLSVPCELTEAVKTRNVVITTVILESYDDVSADLAEKLLHQVFHNANGDPKLQDAIVEILELLLDVPVNVNVKNSEGQTVLHLAVENRMTQVIKFLIGRGADLVSDDRLLHRVFHNANDLELQAKIIEILDILLNHSLNVNIVNYAGLTALHLAVESRMTRVIEFLISRGADPKVRDNSGKSLLQFAIRNELLKLRDYSRLENADKTRAFKEQSVNFVEWLTRRNFSADLNIIDNEKNYTTLYLAIENRLMDLILFLTVCGANWRNAADGNTALHFFIDSEYRRILTSNKEGRISRETWQQSVIFVNWMASRKPEYVDMKNSDGDTPLHLATKCQMIHLLPSLLKHTRDVRIVDKSGRTAFQLFADFIAKAPTCVALAEKIGDVFLGKGFSVDVSDDDDNTPLHLMLHGRKRGCAKSMLKYAKDVDARDERRNTALNLVVNYDEDSCADYREIDEELVRILLSKGANIHKPNRDGVSPLTAAVEYKKLNVLRIFKEREEDFFCRSFTGESLLHRFVASNVRTSDDMAILDLLINEGCDVNAKDHNGQTPLHKAVQSGKLEIAECLMKSGALVNSRDSLGGYSPLHAAAVQCNRANLLALLIENGADVNATTFTGQTALHMDIDGDVASILIKSGAWIDVTDEHDYLPLQRAILKRNGSLIEELMRFGADINDNAHVLRKRDYLSASFCVSEHMIKLRAAELPIDEKLECIIVRRPRDNDFDEIHEDCLVEIEVLKTHMIDDCRSLYDFLHMNRNSMCAHVKNKKLEELIESSRFSRDFPLYHTLISSAYHMADKRRKMLGPARQAWLELTGIGLPDLCLHEIFKHVSNVTLRSMIGGVKNEKYRF